MNKGGLCTSDKDEACCATEEAQVAINSFETERLINVSYDKTLRMNIDRELQILKQLPASRERSLAITKLQEAIMWLGMDLKRLNEPNPYPQSYNPNSPDIEPTADGLKL